MVKKKQKTTETPLKSSKAVWIWNHWPGVYTGDDRPQKEESDCYGFTLFHVPVQLSLRRCQVITFVWVEAKVTRFNLSQQPADAAWKLNHRQMMDDSISSAPVFLIWWSMCEVTRHRYQRQRSWLSDGDMKWNDSVITGKSSDWRNRTLMLAAVKPADIQLICLII